MRGQLSSRQVSVRRIRASVEDRLLLRSEIGDNGCWVYRGTVDPEGYGRIQVAGLSKRAHRTMYELRVGPIPEGLVVMHSCDNPPCINPAHLSVGTQAQNIADRERKGRGHRKRRADMKLPLDECFELVRERDTGVFIKDLAAKYGVSKTTVMSIYKKVKGGRI